MSREEYRHDYVGNFFDYVHPPAIADRAATRSDFREHMSADLCDRFGLSGTISRDIARTVCNGMERARIHFHTPCHVLAIFQLADRVNAAGLMPALDDVQVLAVWFHDAVYRPEADPGRNEAESIALMRQVLAGLAPCDAIAKAANIIEATDARSHSGTIVVPGEAEIILDLDVSNLGWEPSAYRKTLAPIRDEFMTIYGVDRWITGRRAFLTAMLARSWIYRTPPFRDNFEARARTNIAGTLDLLDAGEP